MSPHLVSPHPKIRDAFLRMFEDYESFGEYSWCRDASQATENFEAYVDALRGEAIGRGISSDWAPTSHYWLQQGEDLLGTLRIRHSLTPAVEARAGHIGYDISPSFRGRALGHVILDLEMNKASQMAIGDILAICSADNTASRRIIEKRGGSIQKTKDGEIWYWIPQQENLEQAEQGGGGNSAALRASP